MTMNLVLLSLYSRKSLSHAHTSSLQYIGAVLMEFLSRFHLSANHVTSCQIASRVTKLVVFLGLLTTLLSGCV